MTPQRTEEDIFYDWHLMVFDNVMIFRFVSAAVFG